jgi:transposase-like protein
MTRRRYTDEEKAEALRLVAEHGHGEAARRTGINPGTIGSWATRANVSSPDPVTSLAPVAKRLATTVERKEALASNLLDDLERLRQRIFAPIVVRKPMSVSLGRGSGSEIEIVDVKLDQPTPQDQRALVSAIATGLGAVQLLTGEATERIEQVQSGITPEKRAEAAEAARDELAARRRTSAA